MKKIGNMTDEELVNALVQLVKDPSASWFGWHAQSTIKNRGDAADQLGEEMKKRFGKHPSNGNGGLNGGAK